MRILYRELALADLQLIARYLGQRSPAGARNVMLAIHAAIQEVADQPRAARTTSDAAVRVKIVRR